MLIIHHTLHNNRKKVLIVQHTLENRPKNEILSYTRMLCGQNRSARENKRKREISRDFSRFFDPEFFRSFIDPFCPFRCCVRTRTHEKGFFASYRKQSTLWAGFGLAKAEPDSVEKLPLHKLFTNTIDPSSNCPDSNPRKRKICLLSVC